MNSKHEQLFHDAETPRSELMALRADLARAKVRVSALIASGVNLQDREAFMLQALQEMMDLAAKSWVNQWKNRLPVTDENRTGETDEQQLVGSQ